MSNAGLILVFNSGSSSLKVALFARTGDDESLVAKGSLNGIGSKGTLKVESADGSPLADGEHTAATQELAMEAVVHAFGAELTGQIGAIGHRVVHGGPHLRNPTVVTADVLQQLEQSTHFAPLHIPESLRVIRHAQQMFPELLQVVCFDTAFHQTMPPVASRLPVPERYRTQGLQRFGFHGISCESVMHRVGSQELPRVIIAHLGGGSSVTAVKNGRSIDTTMGFSPTGGVVMSTRSGDLDPGVLLFMLRSEEMSTDTLEQVVNHQCGLIALSNGVSDMQQLLGSTDENAKLAVEAYALSIRKAIAGLTAVLGGVDLLVFTGGIGQHSEAIRSQVLAGLDFLDLAESSSTVRTLPAEEEIMIARHVRAIAI